VPDINDILKRARPREAPVVLYLAGDKAAELERLERQLADLGTSWQPGSLAETDPRTALAEQIATARTALAEW
jgi:hypothetical protein